MKRSDLKELIKKSMLEVAPKSGAMTPEEEKMVADYEEEEVNKYALDKEEPMEEASVILNQDEVYAKYAPLVKQYMENGLDKYAAISKAEDVLAAEYGATPLNINRLSPTTLMTNTETLLTLMRMFFVKQTRLLLHGLKSKL
jgi:hypothetical protein